jgi:hypothetical protein
MNHPSALPLTNLDQTVRTKGASSQCIFGMAFNAVL